MIPATSAASNVPPAISGGMEDASRKSLSSDLDTFLKLLTAQIENQDPLEPTDGTEYASQLATFSGVEQAVRTNELLSDMVTQMNRQDLSAAVGWIGMDVQHDGPLAVTGAAVPLSFAIPAAADRAELVVTDDDGVEVMRRPVDPTSERLDWSGDDGRGTVLPDGTYTVKIVPYAGEQELARQSVSHYARVGEVAMGPEGPELVLPGGVRIGLAEMSALRQAPSGA